MPCPCFFFFNDTATTEIYTLSLHDALPICRMGRLLAVFAANPGLVGIGLDEDTAVLIDRDGLLEVLGTNMVTIIDGRDTMSDYFDREDGEILSITGSSLHVLAGGRRFDLNARQAIGMDA